MKDFYKEQQEKRFCERLAAKNAEAKRKNEKNRHRRPVKAKPLDADSIDFKMF